MKINKNGAQQKILRTSPEARRTIPACRLAGSNRCRVFKQTKN